MKLIVRAFFLLAFLGLFAGCESAEEKAEKHFQSALALIEAGDEQRAIIEFKNVFKLNGRHEGARMAYADLQRARGDIREALGQYLRLVEQYPDHIAAHLSASEIYAEIGNWPEMERLLTVAQEIDPDDLKTQALQLVFDYRQAVADKEFTKAESIAEKASALIEKMPDYLLLRQVQIDDHIRAEAYELARQRLDDALAVAPDNRSLYAVRLSVLAALGDSAAIERQLKDMIARFPDDDTSRATLVRWYISQGQLDEAESYLRQSAEGPQATTDGQLTLIRFLGDFRSPEIAQAELARIIDAGGASPILNSLQAGYIFDAGNQSGAIAEMRSLIAGLEPGEDTQTVKIALARMLILADDQTGARALVQDVLAENADNIQALKLKANWLIGDDQVGDAITALRTALELAPKDPETLTLLARAYQRDGNQSLVGDMLALAMDASNTAPEETIRYARYLVERGKNDVAERVLIDALRLSPDHVDILTELGQVYVVTADWPRATQVRQALARIATEPARNAGNELQARILQSQQKTSEAITFLQSLVRDGDAGFGAHVAIIESHLTNGEPELAKAYVESLLAEDPENNAVRFLDATLDVAVGENNSAERKYRVLLNDDPKQVPVWIALFRLLSATDRGEEAAKSIDLAREILPDDATLKWVKAGLLETDGDFESAITIYEDMYATDSDNLIIANNLASLLSTARTDAASLDRAYIIARRLRSADLPAYQDTYGWIAHLRGEDDEAIRALEQAAIGMADDPQVQYHLAMAYLAGKRESDALEQFRKVLTLAGGTDGRDFVLDARAKIDQLTAQEAEGENK